MSEAGSVTVTERRVVGVDRLRGLAVLLMVLDHVVALVDPAAPVRYTLTRLSLPAFMAAAAAVWSGRLSGRSCRRLLAVAVVEAALVAALGLGQPGIVAVYLAVAVGVSVAWPWVRSHVGLVVVLGLIQAFYVRVGWDGYEPGLVLAWFALGLLARSEVVDLGERLPAWLSSVGRRPLAWYVGHLAVLAAVVVAS